MWVLTLEQNRPGSPVLYRLDQFHRIALLQESGGWAIAAYYGPEQHLPLARLASEARAREAFNRITSALTDRDTLVDLSDLITAPE